AVLRKPDVVYSFCWFSCREGESVSLAREFPGIIEGRLHRGVSPALGRVVEVAAENDWARRILIDDFFNLVRTDQPFGIIGAMINVGIHKYDFATINAKHELQQATLFAGPQHFVVRVVPANNWKSRQNCVAIFTSLVMEIVAEYTGHADQFGQFLGQ